MAILVGLLASTAPAQKVDIAARILPPRAAPGEAVRPYVKVDAPVIVLRGVRVIDGTGAPLPRRKPDGPRTQRGNFDPSIRFPKAVK